jgi:pimeloyl-ACP methyl ester carboxylesterase
MTSDMQPRQIDIRYLLDGVFYRLAVTCWGDPHAQPVVCVHGLTRQGRDFDVLAQTLSENFYVVCPDLPGRGRSDWLTPQPPPAPSVPNGLGRYTVPTYVHALSHLLAFIDRPVHWVGTSLGGICGMMIAAATNQPILRMVLNDIGPLIPAAALARIGAYVTDIPAFETRADIEAYLRRVHAPFGELTDSHWADLARYSTRTGPDGSVALHYDPNITQGMDSIEFTDQDSWQQWDRIAIPMLTLRGATSDLLLPETLQRMAAKSAIHTVAGAGHAPALMDAPTMTVVRDFLRGD